MDNSKLIMNDCRKIIFKNIDEKTSNHSNKENNEYDLLNKLENFKNIDKNIEFSSKFNEESNSENLTKKDKYLKTFPIDNNNFNYLIVDSNLAIKDNLKNIFFIEFDLKNEQNDLEFINYFTEINNEKVNKDINFLLKVILTYKFKKF